MMISLATVFTNTIQGQHVSNIEYQKIFLQSLIEKTKLVSEVLICCVDKPAEFREEWTERGIRFVKFGPRAAYAYKSVMPPHCANIGLSLQHGLGIHACIDAASNDYIFCTDPDIFFYSAVDEVYYNLMQQYQLQFVGCGRHNATNICYGYFPYIHNSLFYRPDLPDENFMKGQYTRRLIEEEYGKDNYTPGDPEVYDGRFLYPARIEGYDHYFPYPEKGNIDTGAYLFVWACQKDWRWLSFLTPDRFNYTTKYFRNSKNLKIKDKISPQKLIYHQSESMFYYPRGVSDFCTAYLLNKEDQE